MQLTLSFVSVVFLASPFRNSVIHASESLLHDRSMSLRDWFLVRATAIRIVPSMYKPFHDTSNTSRWLFFCNNLK